MPTINSIWANIKACEGQAFHQKRGKEFTYIIVGNVIKLETTNRNIPKSNVAMAISRFPITNTAKLQDLQGPSYLYALLTDVRIVGGE